MLIIRCVLRGIKLYTVQIQRQENTKVQKTAKINGEKARKRWDIPIGQIIENGQCVPPTPSLKS
jgi:hypothetical protein